MVTISGYGCITLECTVPDEQHNLVCVQLKFLLRENLKRIGVGARVITRKS